MSSFRRVLILLLACLSAAQLGSAASIKIENAATVTLEESDGTATETATLGYKAKLKGPLKLDHTQKLKVSFKVLDTSGKPFQPEQAFLRLTSVASGKAAFFAAAFKADKLDIVATSSGVEDQLGTQGGQFEASLILGSSSPEAAIDWSLGTITVSHRPAPDGNQPPAPKSRIETLVEPKPEIVHQHRKPETRTSPIVSLIFAVISLIPLAAFLLGAGKIGANLKGLPSSGPEWVYAVGFHAGIAAILLVYIMFWLGLNLMQTFPIVVVLEVVTLTFGIKAAAAAGTAPQPQKSEKKE